MVAVDTQLGPYKVLAPLGAGGMGEVYRAMDIRLGREVALKVLPSQFAADPLRLARFEREARAVAALAHPNLVVLYDFGTDQGITFAVMELLEGETLRDRMGQRALPWRKSVEIAVAVADGLAAAHAKGIVHRDLKPANVFITADERVKILDFGLAKVGESPPLEKVETQSYSPAQTKTGTILGTAPYMSPEQLRGQPTDGRCDLFSFGCMLYEMVAGKRPFTGNTDVEMTAAILHDDPPELTDSGKSLPLEVQRIIRRCLEKNPEARFQSARDLAFALRSLLNTGDVPLAAPASATGRARAVLWIAAAALLPLMAIGIYLLARSGPGGQDDKEAEQGARQIKAIAVLPFVNESKDPDASYLSDGIPGSIKQDLQKIHSLEVRQLTSKARFYKGADTDLQEVARELRVQAVLSGKVSQRKDRLTVSVELVDARDMNVLLSGQFEGKSEDLQEKLTEIAKQICTKLRLQLSGAEEQRLARRDTTNPEAFLLYLQGRYHWGKANQESMKKAFECFNLAIEKDPAYALAYAGLADTYGLYAGPWLPYVEALPKWRAAAQKALELDPDLAEAHVAVALVLIGADYDWPAGEKEIRRAIQLKPNLALAHDLYGTFLDTQGRFEEAQAEHGRAIELDPLTPLFITNLSASYYFMRRYDLGIKQAHKALDLDPNFVVGHSSLGWCHMMSGQYPAALKAFQKCRELDDIPFYVADMALAHARAGDMTAARKNLEELKAMQEKGRNVVPDCFFYVYLGLGEKDLAFEWLQKMYDQRSGGITWLKVDPFNEPIRADPRFAEWLKRLKFSP
jgi:eukaryotic-like serine/threonine-protein kinase